MNKQSQISKNSFAGATREKLPGELLKKTDTANRKRGKDSVEAKDFRFYCQSSEQMSQCDDESVALTVTSPPYWNAIDYDTHANHGSDVWHREREYTAFGDSFEDYLDNIVKVFTEVLRATSPGGFCAIVVGTLLHKGRHYPIQMLITERLCGIGWEFHQDIIWNKVTGGVRRAGVFIQKPRAGYYYPNIMTEYILIFRKPGTPRRGAQKAMDIDDLFTRDIANNVWHIAPVPPNFIDHPCPFPGELARRLILLYSDEGDEVLDPFLGSGQTALASVGHGRRCVGYDIEAKYIALAHSYMMIPPPSRKYNLIARFEKIAGT
ncbi:MAG: site-specific DNA-methyltransferase [Rhodobacteraceae bacterium]|nr:site-specific DNA-methyltransferase [Paracoccaceae bacterium]